MKMKKWYSLAFLGRATMMLYGVWQDASMAVKYTDVDYYVFTDAAQFVAQGESPYQRSTYRYTPLLAWALTLNIWLSPLIGKLIFIAFDILVGHTIFSLVRESGMNYNTARNCALVWLLNPLPAAVSSRGNAESIMAYLVLISLTSLVRGKTVTSAVFFALAIHVKIYPITYALPIYLYLGNKEGHVPVKAKGQTHRQSAWSVGSVMSSLMPNRERLKFISVGGAVLGTLTLIFYHMYGWIFLYETYLYHIVRGDIRHNFSPYFYLLYLTSDPVAGVPLCLRLLVFLPQAALLIAVATRFYQDQPLCWFLCTFVFVMANKVCTSQYFLWYLSLLPVILPQIKLTMVQSAGLLSLWFASQALWLLPAYYLEFEGQNTFLWIWAAGLLFFIANAGIVSVIITHYKRKLKRQRD